MTRIIQQLPNFKRAYKKLHTKEKSFVDKAILEIFNNPEIGTEKKGDLADTFVYKFKIHHQEILLAYEWNDQALYLLALGSHENFYRDLKKRF